MDRKIFLLMNDYLCWLAGGYKASKKTAIRLVIGAWCLLTLVLLNVYNSTLISYITTTQNAQVLANSIEEVAADPNINLVITKNLGVDIVLSVSTTCTNLRRY
jgi:hypothetical protein